MASIGQLVRVVAQVSGLEEGAVKLIARYVREAGLITQQSTGGGAAKMTARDAASLLIAVNGAELAKNAAEAVLSYGKMTSVSTTSGGSLGEEDFIRRDLMEFNDFHGFLERVISRYMPVVSGFSVLNYPPEDAPIRVIVEFEKPNVSVSFSMYRPEDHLYASGSSFHLYFSAEIEEDILVDRIVKISMTHKTLYAVANAITD